MSNADPFDPSPKPDRGNRPPSDLNDDPAPGAHLFSQSADQDAVAERLPETIERFLPDAVTRLRTCAQANVLQDLTEKIVLWPRRRVEATMAQMYADLDLTADGDYASDQKR